MFIFLRLRFSFGLRLACLRRTAVQVLYTAMPTMWLLPTTASLRADADAKQWTDDSPELLQGDSIAVKVARDRRLMQRQRLVSVCCGFMLARKGAAARHSPAPPPLPPRLVCA